MPICGWWTIRYLMKTGIHLVRNKIGVAYVEKTDTTTPVKMAKRVRRHPSVMMVSRRLLSVSNAAKRSLGKGDLYAAFLERSDVY